MDSHIVDIHMYMISCRVVITHPHPIVTIISFSLFLLLSTLPSSLSQPPPASDHYSICWKPYKCGDQPDLYYPFSGGDRPSFCGGGGDQYQLTCNEADGYEYSSIQMGSQKFEVWGINPVAYTMHMEPVAEEGPDVCSPQFNFSLSPLFRYTQTVLNITVFSDCPSGVALIGGKNFTCGSDNLVVYYVGAKDKVLERHRDLEKCKRGIQVPAEAVHPPKNGGDGGVPALNDAFGKGFNVSYTISQECMRCHGSSGACGSNDTTHEFTCYCPDGSNHLNCTGHVPVPAPVYVPVPAPVYVPVPAPASSPETWILKEDESCCVPDPSIEKDYNYSFNDSALENEDKGLGPLASSTMDLSLEQKDWCALEGLYDSNNNISENVTSTSEVSIMENLSGENKGDSVAHADSSSINPDPLASLSLEEKVANFIQNGDLDPVEVSDGDDSQESKVNLESEPVADMPLGTCPPSDNNAMALNGSSLTSNHHVPSGTMGQLLKDDHMRHIDQTTNFNTNLDAEVPKEQNQSEINYLKFMLYQKELELSRLKEQIEKEKLSLSVLQTKAEAEINKARKLISEKDAELHVAEESLSGLKEVQVEFCGDGDVVEVAGSFNGWHHRIKMDPQPSTSAIDFGGSRRSRFWSTTLWLYPGVYEIKFVVDGHWRLDSQRESVTRGHICNNILRVDR